MSRRVPSVVIDFDDKIFKEVKDDSVMLKDMNLAVQAVYDQTCNGIQSKLKAFDKLVQVMVDMNAPLAKIEAQLKGLNDSIEKDRDVAEQASKLAVQEVWQKYKAKRKAYLKYEVTIAANILGSTAALFTSIGLTVASGFSGGAATAFTILGMIKSVVSIGKEIASAWMEVETAQGILELQLKHVDAAMKLAGGKKVNELSSTVVNQFLGISQPSIKNCQKQLDTIEKKLLGIEIKTHEASKTLNQILDEEEELRKDFMKEVVDRLGKHSSEKGREQIKTIEAKLDAWIGGPFRAIQTQLDVVQDLYKRFQNADKLTQDLSGRVQALGALRTLDEKIFENIVILVDIPLAALNGNAMADKAKDLVNGLVPAATSLAYDKIKGKALEGSWLA